MLPVFVTWPLVLRKLTGGADLMLPGVVVPDCCAITLVMNRAPVAIGTAAVSSAEMRNSGMKGKGVNILHTYMDQLWAFGDSHILQLYRSQTLQHRWRENRRERNARRKSRRCRTALIQLQWKHLVRACRS